MVFSGKKKKKKVSKVKLKKIVFFKGKKLVEKQGKGVGLRKSFSLLVKWLEEYIEIDGKI